MTYKKRQSCIYTIQTLRRLALNIHGVIDVVDDMNCNELIRLLQTEPCVSEQTCHEDKVKVLEKIKTEIEAHAYPIVHGVNNHELGMTLYGILQVIDRYIKDGE